MPQVDVPPDGFCRMPMNKIALVVQLLRPAQWTKNLVVLAAFFFALGDHTQALRFNHVVDVVLAAILFCVVSSGIYIVNDILDAPHDRLHPDKRNRPIAAGAIPPATALMLAGVLLVAGIGGGYLLARPFALVVTVYVILQFLYSLALKRVALVDVLVIALGFVLRAIAGAVVVVVVISPWLLLCTFLLALFLGLCKRRHELVTLERAAIEHRASLAHYDHHFLDQLIAIVSSATIVCYSIYTLWPDTVAKFGTEALAATIPLVVFGIFRYLYLVYREAQGGRPERILLRDIPLIVDLVLYAAMVGFIFYAQK